MALVLVLATCYVCIDFSSRPSGTADDMPLDEVVQDVDLLPAIDRSDMIAAAPQGAPAKATMQKLNVVDQVKQNMEKQEQLDNLRTANRANGSGGDNGKDEKTDRTDKDTQAQSPVAVDADNNPLQLRIVEQLPEFPGGMVAMMKWLTRNLRYPYLAQQRKIQGKVVVTFIINRDGSIADIKIARPADPLLNSEALRVVRLMPRWKPGMQNGKPCRTMFAIPVEFRL